MNSVSDALETALAAAPAVGVARRALGGEGWLVGGALRDAALGAAVTDVDLAVEPGREQPAARAIADEAGGFAFALSDEFPTFRALARDGAWHLDVTALRAAGIEEDLAARDFTVNAIAIPLAGGEPIDPTGGLADAEAGVLRAVSERSFADDPLRIMRAARITASHGLAIEPETLRLAREQAPRAAEPAGERRLAELRAMLTGPSPIRALEALDELGATAEVLPELEALRGVEQNPYHHLDVYGHTIAVLEQATLLPRHLDELFGELAPSVAELLEEPLADELDRDGALRFAALVHDFGKPETRTVNEEGRVMFMGHDRAGAEIARELCRRLRTSVALAKHLESLTLNHLRLGFLVHERPLSRRQVFAYLQATSPAPVDVILLTICDRLATRGPRTREEAVEAHLDLARELLAEAIPWQRQGPPPPPLRGDDLVELGMEPGPEMGRVLEELAAAAFAGEIEGREQAVELARRLSS